MHDTAPPATADATRTIRVWDLPTRLFHWLLVLAVAFGALSGFFAPESWLGLHAWSGYGLAALLAFRLVWGVFGSEYSRISSFAWPPRAVAAHLRSLIAGRHVDFPGHNPAGAMMIFALGGVLVAIVASGLVALGGEEKQGPLAGLVSYRAGDAAGELHEALVFVLLAMVALHVAGVVLESVLGRSNLVVAMITGRKRLPAKAAVTAQRPARPVAAAVAVLLLVLAGAGAGAALGALPPLGVRSLALDEAYRDECGDCHYAFHPSLLPAASWSSIMAGLDDHFGEDATLDDATRNTIAAWLTANAAETWDTKAANRFRNVSAEQPLRITATRFWDRRHHDIERAVFERRTVGSKVNCIACHRDADTGLFADQSIAIPEEKR